MQMVHLVLIALSAFGSGYCLAAWRLHHIQKKYDRLTDRDERGRFVKRERS
jgi:hypothetical protein